MNKLCMMLRSANDAANVLAEEVSGSLESFASLMNQRAYELGAQNTHFSNANGLPTRYHFTTAYDMAIITRQAIQIPGFMTYFGADRYTISSTNRCEYRIFTNTHRMLQENHAVYSKDVIGGKTGYTVPAGYTLVTVAQRSGRTLICVVLKSASYYTDTQTLLDFGFDEFSVHIYHFATELPMETSIVEADWEAGRARYAQPDSVTLLLHDSVETAKIAVEYRYPDIAHTEEDVEGSVVLSLSATKQNGLPQVLLTVPMQAQLTWFPPLPEEEIQDSALGSRGFVVLLLCIAAALMAAAIRLITGRGRAHMRSSRYRQYSNMR